MMVQAKICRTNLNIGHFFLSYFLNIIVKPLHRVIEMHIGKMRPKFPGAQFSVSFFTAGS